MSDSSGATRVLTSWTETSLHQERLINPYSDPFFALFDSFCCFLRRNGSFQEKRSFPENCSKLLKNRSTMVNQVKQVQPGQPGQARPGQAGQVRQGGQGRAGQAAGQGQVVYPALYTPCTPPVYTPCAPADVYHGQRCGCRGARNRSLPPSLVPRLV